MELVEGTKLCVEQMGVDSTTDDEMTVSPGEESNGKPKTE